MLLGRVYVMTANRQYAGTTLAISVDIYAITGLFKPQQKYLLETVG